MFHIPANRDFVLPMRCTHPDEVVAGAGHVISHTHPSEVNRFIRAAMSQTTDEPGRRRLDLSPVNKRLAD